MCCELLRKALFGNLESALALRYCIEDLVEGANAVHELVVLRDDGGEARLGVSLAVRDTVVVGAGAVGEAAALAQFLEDDAVHAAAEVLVVECCHGRLFYLPRHQVVVEGNHIDVLGIVGCDDDFRGGRLLLLVVLEGWCWQQGLGERMLLGEELRDVALAAGTVVEDGMLEAGERVNEVDERLRVGGCELCCRDDIALGVALPIYIICAQA